MLFWQLVVHTGGLLPHFQLILRAVLCLNVHLTIEFITWKPTTPAIQTSVKRLLAFVLFTFHCSLVCRLIRSHLSERNWFSFRR